MPDETKRAETLSPLEPDPSVRGPSARHVAALDGVRGVAILWVMLFHGVLRSGWNLENSNAAMKLVLSGWLGVDVFFVLSGFLITGILLDTKSTARFFTNFYARRALRIMPVYYLVLLVTLVIIPIFIPYDTPQLKMMFDRQGWLWLHLTNVGFIYYKKAWLLTPWLDMSHLWSLAVEEQFYLIWPAVVWLVAPRRLVWLCLAGIVGAPLLRLALWHAGQTAGAMCFATPCRVDGLAFGALVALIVRGEGFAVGSRWIGAMLLVGGLGLAGLAWVRHGLWFADKAVIAFAPILVNLIVAAVILHVVRGGRGRMARLLENPALRLSGRYSYGLYLFHPLLAAPLGIWLLDSGVLGTVGSLGATALFTALVFCVTFGLALLSYHAFEKRWLALRTRFHAVPEQVHRAQPAV